MVKDAIQKAVDNNEGVLCEMTSKGYDEQGTVFLLLYSWSFKILENY